MTGEAGGGTQGWHQEGRTPSTEGIRALAQMCQEAGVEALEASNGSWAVRLRLDPSLVVAGTVGEAQEAAEPAGPHLLLSQWVGIFHLGPEGEGEPLAREGRAVKEGDVLGVVAAMQLQHDLLADRSGMLLRFLVEDGTPVEYGQPLAEIG